MSFRQLDVQDQIICVRNYSLGTASVGPSGYSQHDLPFILKLIQQQ